MISSITLEDISKKFSSSNFSLHIDHFKFGDHDLHVIVGPNGSGKSTLLKLISLMDKPDEGRILFDDNDILHANNGRGKLRKKIGFVTQNPYLFNMDVFDNIVLGLKIRKYQQGEITSKAAEILDILKISHLQHRNIKELSGGECQKVALAQVLVLKPEVTPRRAHSQY